MLLVLLAALGVTIVRIHPLIWEHLFIGLLLLGPVALKLGSTGYRFVRYYTHDPVYLRKGPPPPSLRLLGPLVVLSTVVVFASGVALLLLGPSSRSTLLLVHKASFFVWLAATAVHVLGHLPEVTRALDGGDAHRGRSLRPARVAPDAHSRSPARLSRGWCWRCCWPPNSARGCTTTVSWSAIEAALGGALLAGARAGVRGESKSYGTSHALFSHHLRFRGTLTSASTRAPLPPRWPSTPTTPPAPATPHCAG